MATTIPVHGFGDFKILLADEGYVKFMSTVDYRHYMTTAIDELIPYKVDDIMPYQMLAMDDESCHPCFQIAGSDTFISLVLYRDFVGETMCFRGFSTAIFQKLVEQMPELHHFEVNVRLSVGYLQLSTPSGADRMFLDTFTTLWEQFFDSRKNSLKLIPQKMDLAEFKNLVNCASLKPAGRMEWNDQFLQSIEVPLELYGVMMLVNGKKFKIQEFLRIDPIVLTRSEIILVMRKTPMQNVIIGAADITPKMNLHVSVRRFWHEKNKYVVIFVPMLSRIY